MIQQLISVLTVSTSLLWAQDRFATPAPENQRPLLQVHSEPRHLGSVTGATCNATMVRQGRSIPIKTFPVKVLENDELTCDETGKMDVEMVDKSIVTIYHDARVQVGDYLLREKDPGVLVLNALGGAFRFSSDAFAGKKDRYLVHTKTGIIGVRGTIFTVEVIDATKSTVSVERGEVRVQSKVSKAEKFVSKGRKVEVTALGVTEVKFK